MNRAPRTKKGRSAGSLFIVQLLLFGLAMAAAAELSALTVQATADTPVPVYIYLPLGLGLGVLLAGGFRFWPGVALGGLFREAFLFMQDPSDLILEVAKVAVIWTFLGLIEVLFAYWLTRLVVTKDVYSPLLSPRSMGRFAISTVLTSVLAALAWVWIITVSWSSTLEPDGLWRVWALRFLANALGMVLLVPTVVAIGRVLRRRRLSPRHV